MATKLQYYQSVAERTTNELTAKSGNWMRFLDSAARLYKYPFQDQMMIFAQKPEATACAELDLWNERFSRWVRRGSKGIALIDYSGQYPRLKYVFDVSDTEPSLYKSRPVHLWEMRQEHRTPVMSELAKNYEDIDPDGTLADAFRSIANQLTREYYDDNRREIAFRSERSVLEPEFDYDGSGIAIEQADDAALRAAFAEAVSASVAYAVMTRCGLDTSEYFDERDFWRVTDFNTPDMVSALGSATAELSEQVLRDVEIVVRKFERLRNAERSEQNHDRSDNIHAERGLPSPEHNAERAAGERIGAPGTLGNAEESVPARAQEDNVQLPDNLGEAVPAPERGGRGGEPEVRADNDGADGADEPAGQGNGAAEVDGGDEHAESSGDGSDPERTDLRGLEPAPAAPILMKEQDPKIASISEILSASPISLDEVDFILRDGGNFDDHGLDIIQSESRSALRIAAHFAKGLDDNTGYLRDEYLLGRYGREYQESGKGFDFGNRHVCAWFTVEGIELAIGVTAKNNIHKVLIPWESATARIDELMREGRFVSSEAYAVALDNERRELADDLWSFYRDDMGEIPEDVERIRALLNDENERQAISDRLKVSVNAWFNGERSRSWHNPIKLLAKMEIAMKPPVVTPGDGSVPEKSFSYFITQDEIDAVLTYGSVYSEGKFRILSFLLGDHDANEKVAFFKERYGHGGGTWVYTNGWQNSEPGKGVNIQRGNLRKPAAEVNLKWPAVVKRTEHLIENGLYMTRAELDRIPNYERLMLVRSINNFYGNLPEDYERPFPGKNGTFYNEYRDENGEKTLDFHYPHEAEWEAVSGLLDNPERLDIVLSRMRHIFENTSEDDRYYDLRKTAYENLIAFQNGTYTLFPGIKKMPDPEAAVRSITPRREIVEDLRESPIGDLPTGKPAQSVQMSFFDTADDSPLPILPSVEEQRIKINQSQTAEAEVDTPVVSLPITQDEIDALLRSVGNTNKARIAEKVAANPRSREAVQLIREIYGGMEESIPRLGGADGYLWIMGDTGGVTIHGGVAFKNPKTEPPPVETLTMNWPAVIKRVAELVADGRFSAAVMERQDPAALAEYQKIKAENPGCVVFYQVGRTIEFLREDAETAAKLLDLSLAYRDAGLPEPIGVLVIPMDALSDAVDTIYEAGHGLAIAGLTEYEGGERTVTAIPYEAEAAAENAVETDAAEKSDAVYYSPISGVPYREGDIVERVFADAKQVVINTIDADNVYYTPVGEPASSAVAMARDTFEMYLDNGDFRIREEETLETAVQDKANAVLDEYRRIKEENGGAVVLWQVGAFFEAYGEDAKTIADMLGLALTERKFEEAGAVPMSGVPGNRLSAYANELNGAGIAVAVANSREDGSRSVFIYPAKPAVEQIPYNVGDKLLFDGKPHEIEEIGEYVRLRNLGEPSAYPIFDHVSIQRQDFERRLADKEIIISAGEFDFDAVAETVLRRVMADTEFAAALNVAQGRAAMRGYLTTALQNAVYEHMEDEPQVYRAYNNDDDFNEKLFDFVYRQSWELRKQREAEPAVPAEQALKPIAEKLLSRDGTDYYLFHSPEPDETPAALSVDTLSLITERADRYVICADVCYLSEDNMARFGVEFRKMPRDLPLLPDDVQAKINELRPDYLRELIREDLSLHGFTVSDELIADGIREYGNRGHIQDIEDFIENEYLTDDTEVIIEADEPEPEPPTTSPPPVFVVNWDKAKHDFDLSLYKDRDVIAYGKDGVKHTLGRSGSLTYVTTSSFLWGGNEVPGDIYEQINAYKDGKLTDEQVRENYLKVLADYAGNKAGITAEGENPAEAPDDTSEQQPRFSTLEEIETELDRKVKLMRGNPNYEKIREAADYWKSWRQMFHREGVAADALVKQINAMNDVQAVEWFSQVPWDNWRETLDLGDFEPLSVNIRRDENRNNFHITDDHLGEGGAKTKFRNNINALQTLKTIESEHRSATTEEQETLSRYVGWGGLPQAFDPENKDWANEYSELSAQLTPDEFDSARASTLNAHFTSPVVVKSIWETMERIGFKNGNVLEPSMGVGNFFGLLPDSMRGSKLYGVELDSVTARIAKLLYPNADIQQTGFEKTEFSDAFFDLAIGNVPFGSYGVADRRYDKHDFSIHNYFFAKALDKVRPGGVVAFVTSKYTMDERSPLVRKYLAERADLLGAVRLPNNAFLKNAGTETTMDILFLQKRDRPLDIEPDWVHLGMTEDGIPVNRYFLDNPETVCGVMGFDERMNGKYGRDDTTACLPIEGADLGEQLKSALLSVRGTFEVDELDDLDGVDNHAIPADYGVKNFSYAVVDDTVYFRENSLMYPVGLPVAALERIKGMIGLRDCVHELIDLQLDDFTSDATIKRQQRKLNDLYDGFIAEFGLISSQTNNRAFNADSSYYLLSSLEVLNEDGELERKADIFTKRTIRQKIVVTHVDTASEALTVSLGERGYIDLEYMEELSGISRDKLLEDLRGVVFLNIGNAESPKKAYVTADEYLSGNVRNKLELAKAAAIAAPELSGNVKALEAAMPKELEAGDISVRLGATWIEAKYIQEFMYELLNTTWHNKRLYQVSYHAYTGEWQVTSKGMAQYSDIPSTVTYGTNRMNAYQILDDTLNLRDVRIYDYKEDADGIERRLLNKKETMLAQQKQETIKQAFKDWIWKDPARRHTLVKLYNERFNSVRPREYDGSHITFGGMSQDIELRPHQLNAIAHILYGGNTLLAHEVGAGKTFEMVAAAMEAKRLGQCHKSLFAVPNHLTEQWAAEFLRLYPAANILVATKRDFEMRNRKKFCAKIATGDYDAVIIGHSQLEKIPLSAERQERIIRQQIHEVEHALGELKQARGDRFSVKQLEKTRKSLQARLAKLLKSKTRDDVVTFEELGIDRLYVDEAHFFKNLMLHTKMRNVAGLSTSEAQKSSDLYMKCRYLDELTGNKGSIFATGTPISNSITEMFTMQRYLQHDRLVAMGLSHFDSWASTFGETQTSIELAPEGTGYRARTRFAKFHNLPELMAVFKDVADIQTADMLHLPVPNAKYENIVVEPSELQQEMVQELSARAAKIHARQVDPTVDNMLRITSDGRKIGLDQRLMNPLLPDFEGSKVNACTDKVYEIWRDTSKDRLTQLVFCDFSTPNKDGRFNVYDDIRGKLLERGIPEREIAFIHDADTETKKKELFAKVRQGKVRVLFGSTFKMGAGTNVQDRLVAIHDADCPWRPADLAQRSGRIIRQGNKNAEVQIFRYATSGTFDSYLWQTVQKKQEFIAQIMSSKSPVRSCDDVDETALSYAEVKALCAGNPLIAEKMALDNDVAKLRMLKSEHQSQRFRLEDSLLKKFPEQITAVTERIAGIETDIKAYTLEKGKYAETTTVNGAVSVSAKFPGMTVNGVNYAEKESAAKALLDAGKAIKSTMSEAPIGAYMGFKMSMGYDGHAQQMNLFLRGAMTYKVDLGTDALGNITRINNSLDRLTERLSDVKDQLADYERQTEAAKDELSKPFPHELELSEKETRLAELNAELNIDGDGGLEVLNDSENRDDGPEQVRSAGKRPPSILDDIRDISSGLKPPVQGGKSAEIDI